MKQVCNTSYAIQADGFVEEAEFEAWDAELVTEPRKLPARRQPDVFGGGLDFGGVGNV